MLLPRSRQPHNAADDTKAHGEHNRTGYIGIVDLYQGSERVISGADGCHIRRDQLIAHRSNYRQTVPGPRHAQNSLEREQTHYNREGRYNTEQSRRLDDTHDLLFGKPKFQRTLPGLFESNQTKRKYK